MDPKNSVIMRFQCMFKSVMEKFSWALYRVLPGGVLVSDTVFEIFEEQKKGFNGLTLTFDFWALEVTWIQKYVHHLKAHIWLPI